MHIKKKKKRSQNKIRLARESAPSARRLSSLAPLESSLYQLSNGTKRDSWSARGAPSSPIRNAEKHWKNTKNHAFLQKVSLGFLHHENCRDLNFYTFKPTHILPFISWYYNAPQLLWPTNFQEKTLFFRLDFVHPCYKIMHFKQKRIQ